MNRARCAFLVLACLSGAAQAQVVPSADSFCRTYSAQAIEQIQRAERQSCPERTAPRWLNDQEAHYTWCTSVPRSIAESERDAREQALQACPNQATAAPGGVQTAKPQGQPLKPLVTVPMRVLATSSRLLTPLVNLSADPGLKRIRGMECQLTSVAPDSRHVEISIVAANGEVRRDRNGEPLQRSIQMQPLSTANINIEDAFQAPFGCLFDVQGSPEEFRGSAILYRRTVADPSKNIGKPALPLGQPITEIVIPAR